MAMDFSKSPAGQMARKRMQMTSEKMGGEVIVKLPADKIEASPLNEGLPMEQIDELAASIEKVGLLEPLIVYEKKDGTYELISGHRRYRAMTQVLGWKTVPCIKKKYPEDIHIRFREHADANVLTRRKDATFWVNEIRHAREILASDGFEGSKKEEIQKISEMLGSGASPAQIYRYDGLSKLEPEVLALDEFGLSPATLYAAVKLGPEEQIHLAQNVRNLCTADPDRTITRSEFSNMVSSVKKGEGEKPAADTREPSKRSAPNTYVDKIFSLEGAYLKKLALAKTDEERDAALESIRHFRLQLDEMEKILLENMDEDVEEE
ncbi:MAG: ParB N-terminal domain-containing protein [Lachnospiraceae bacterium]|nr:ParB N-terminal domain-containing protein [Lachnospiraceae bacterium]